MREKLSNVTIGIMRLKSDLWLTLSVIDFAFVSSALAYSYRTLDINILPPTCFHFRYRRQAITQTFFLSSSCRNMNFLKIFHIYDIAMYARTERNLSRYFNLKNPRINQAFQRLNSKLERINGSFKR